MIYDIPTAGGPSLDVALRNGEKPFALVAEFPDVDSVLNAARQVRDADFTVWDVHTPMPIHGMNAAMGLRPTILPWITLAHGLIGAACGLLLCWWMNATTFLGLPTGLQGYQYLISGKPMFSLPANIPVVFETAVLFSALGTLLGLLGLNKLPMLSNPLHQSRLMLRATADRFLVVILADDRRFQLNATVEFLRDLKPAGIELVTEQKG